MSKKTEIQHYRALGENWRPLLEACGVDTAGWPPVELYALADIVRRDREVRKTADALQNMWQAQRAAQLTDDLPPNLTWEEVKSWIPPDFTLQAILLLPADKKAVLKAKVLQAREGK